MAKMPAFTNLKFDGRSLTALADLFTPVYNAHQNYFCHAGIDKASLRKWPDDFIIPSLIR